MAWPVPPSHLDLRPASYCYVLYGVKYIDLVPLAPYAGHAEGGDRSCADTVSQLYANLGISWLVAFVLLARARGVPHAPNLSLSSSLFFFSLSFFLYLSHTHTRARSLCLSLVRSLSCSLCCSLFLSFSLSRALSLSL